MWHATVGTSHLGTRFHLRAYAAPDADWTAMQAHAEDWGWFRLRV